MDHSSFADPGRFQDDQFKLAALPEAAMLLDAVGLITEANSLLCEMLSCTPSDLLGKSVFAVLNGCWNEEPLRSFLEHSDSNGNDSDRIEFETDLGPYGLRLFEFTQRPLTTIEKTFSRLITVRDVTVDQEWEAALAECQTIRHWPGYSAGPKPDPLASISDSQRTRLPARILLAEDTEDFRYLTSKQLRKAGAVVEEAEHGQMALEMLNTAQSDGEPFNLLLTDMQMPVMDGYELVAAIRAAGSRIPIIALTANSGAEERAKCLAIGCDDYLVKLDKSRPLIAACQAWLDGSRIAARDNASAIITSSQHLTSKSGAAETGSGYPNPSGLLSGDSREDDSD